MESTLEGQSQVAQTVIVQTDYHPELGHSSHQVCALLIWSEQDWTVGCTKVSRNEFAGIQKTQNCPKRRCTSCCLPVFLLLCSTLDVFPASVLSCQAGGVIGDTARTSSSNFFTNNKPLQTKEGLRRNWKDCWLWSEACTGYTFASLNIDCEVRHRRLASATIFIQKMMKTSWLVFRH